MSEEMKAELLAARKREKEQAKAVAATETVLAHARANKWETLTENSEEKLARQVKTLEKTRNLIRELEAANGEFHLEQKPGKK